VHASEDDQAPATSVRPPKSRADVRRERSSAVAILFLVIGVPVIAFGFGPSVLGYYDDGHRIDVVCSVRAADANIASSRSAKGAGGSQPQVTFHTSCGNLLYLDGVDRSNMERIAAAVDVGGEYKFIVGAGSFNLRKALKFLKVAPTAYSYSEFSK
jgi:hypothetical protein